MNKFAVVAMFVTVMFAGCAGEDSTSQEIVDKESFEHSAGKGAIAGLVVDDRFRPIELGEVDAGLYQSLGFVLLQETGETVGTTENGEYTFVDLTPGEYKIRAQSADHEAVPIRVMVVEGEFTDVTIQMQRKISDQTTILTQEYSVFVDCYVNVPGVLWWTELNCFLDMSLDSKRGGFQTDYTAVQNITYVVTEYLFSQSGDYGASVGFATGESISEVWATASTNGGDYAKVVMGTEGYENGTDGKMDAARQFLSYVYPDGDTPGAEIAVKAQIIQTVWLGIPEEDVFNYCVLCES